MSEASIGDQHVNEENESGGYNYTKLWNPFMVRFGERVVPVAEVEKAIKFMYHKKPKHGRNRITSLSTLNNRFRFIKTENHMRRLHDMKKDGIKCDTKHMKSFIEVEMETETEKRLANGEKLANDNYLEMFERIRKDHRISDRITATKTWVIKWKKENFPNEMRYAKKDKDKNEQNENKE
ncbi:unnamed protein product [Caenorhabditis brenneri]